MKFLKLIQICAIVTLFAASPVFASSSDAELSESSSEEIYFRPALTDLCGLPKTLIPFALIRESSKTSKAFVTRALKRIGVCDIHSESDDILTTSCINNALAVCCILLGVERAEKIVDTSSRMGTFSMGFDVPGTNSCLKIQTLGLFDGLVPSNIDKRAAFYALPEAERGTVFTNLKSGPRDYSEYVKSWIELVPVKKENNEDPVEAARRLLLKSGHSFNLAVLNNLEKEVLDNCREINDEQSFSYFVAVRVTFDGGKTKMYEHAFVISQFLIHNAPHFFIYQAWVGASTLFEDIENGFHPSGAPWGLARFKTFIADLKKTYVENYSAENVIKCFGYEPDRTKWPKLVYLENDRLFGTHIVYVSSPYCPSDTVTHLEALCSNAT